VDDNWVTFAYFYSPENEIVGDVWLYNRGETSDEREWHDKEKAPFANPSAYVLDIPGLRIPDDESGVSVRWSTDSDRKLMANVFFGKVLLARLCTGSQPGWSLAAKKDGPLAKKLALWPLPARSV
jgi:hypothetical protein